MSSVKVSFSVSIDGFGAAPQHSLENPMGRGGEALADWAVATRTFQRTQGKDGGATFHFVTDGSHRGLEGAAAAANGKDVGIGGGVAAVRQYLRAGLIDELDLAISAVLLGSGERFPGDIDLVKLGYTCTERVAGERATHVVLGRRAPN